MKAKWHCKYCNLHGELDTPITVQYAGELILNAHTEQHKFCPAASTSMMWLVADLVANDIICGDGSIAREPRTQITLYALAVQ